ncbi:hypothetical protein QOT17_023140 [Balamuthia mandrillaris]
MKGGSLRSPSASTSFPSVPSKTSSLNGASASASGAASSGGHGSSSGSSGGERGREVSSPLAVRVGAETAASASATTSPSSSPSYLSPSPPSRTPTFSLPNSPGGAAPSSSSSSTAAPARTSNEGLTEEEGNRTILQFIAGVRESSQNFGLKLNTRMVIFKEPDQLLMYKKNKIKSNQEGEPIYDICVLKLKINARSWISAEGTEVRVELLCTETRRTRSLYIYPKPPRELHTKQLSDLISQVISAKQSNAWTFSFEIKSVQDLQPVDPESMDVYSVLRIGEVIQRTHIHTPCSKHGKRKFKKQMAKRAMAFPGWGFDLHKYYFIVEKDEKLHIILRDWSKFKEDDFLGEAYLSFSLKQREMQKEKEERNRQRRARIARGKATVEDIDEEIQILVQMKRDLLKKEKLKSLGRDDASSNNKEPVNTVVFKDVERVAEQPRERRSAEYERDGRRGHISNSVPELVRWVTLNDGKGKVELSIQAFPFDPRHWVRALNPRWQFRPNERAGIGFGHSGKMKHKHSLSKGTIEPMARKSSLSTVSSIMSSTSASAPLSARGHSSPVPSSHLN